MKHILVGIGEILWDLFPTGKQIGGAPANFAYHASSLGGEGIIVSQVGKDNLGAEILFQLQALGLTTEFITGDEIHPTGTATVDLDQAGSPSFTIHDNGAWDYLPGNLDLMDLANRADAVCFGSLAQRSPTASSVLMKFLRNTPRETLRIFDINLRPPFYSREIIEESFKLANVLKLNDRELSILVDLLELSGDDFSRISQLAERFDFKVVALTRGSRGSMLWCDGERSEHAGYSVKVVDTVGAGDAFTAALALGMLKGYGLGYINELANKVASFVCTCPGATPPVPNILRELLL